MECLFKAKGAAVKAYISPVIREIGRRYRPAVIICPGGGYSVLSQREADLVAIRYHAFGMQAFVLEYSVGRQTFPTALFELAETVSIIRNHSEEWDIDCRKIVICGFSAGGHLAASLGVYWNKMLFKGEYESSQIKPDALILAYPVICSGNKGHKESVDNLEIPDEFKEYPFGINEVVEESMPPVFLWHNADDGAVPVENSLCLIEALARRKVYSEAHIFPTGGHGLSLADECTASVEGQINETCAQWFPMSVEFIKRKLIKGEEILYG